jgi:hypothetical protein
MNINKGTMYLIIHLLNKHSLSAHYDTHYRSGPI